ncbi:translocon-associated protein TRAP alpha subunit [Cavenderia fasciculata]|uniref:Translocon-associated protein TRAP alpha subunit n=1 Tax=Cavenderia fasciculata TaxID=261658 RepID=F4QAX9_CACFS|nr:translocon-associated protein TRAP alpha subunit [Cavenderia fasciculata]EGG15038.1 translocon-associated protein TRAP alpha subunit [Cavenderia fasciculata]|eukprot:XP_004351758.1 translocon-associated protein TRAP alpha subunit [Cavenderia fasciculata]
MYKLTALLFAILLAFICGVLAQEDTIVEEPVAPVSDISFSYIFPDYPTKEFPAGSVIEVLIGFTNNGEVDYNVSAIYASLNHAQETKHYIQNYTKAEYGVNVKPGFQATLPYRFVPSEYLEPRQFALLVSVDYRADQQNFTSTFFNSTILIVEKPVSFDIEHFFLILFGLGLVALIGYIVYGKLPKAQKASTLSIINKIKTSAGVKETSQKKVVKSSAGEDNWLIDAADKKPKKVVKKSNNIQQTQKANKVITKSQITSGTAGIIRFFAKLNCKQKRSKNRLHIKHVNLSGQVVFFVRAVIVTDNSRLP